MKWSEEQTVNFIREYIKYECLYNVNCTQYRNKKLRYAALSALSLSTGIEDFGPKDAYHKMRSLKSTYSQELKKIKRSRAAGAEASDIYTPNIKWFKIFHDALVSVNGAEECLETSHLEMVPSPEVPKIENESKHDNYMMSYEESNESGADLQSKKNVNPKLNRDRRILKKQRKRTLKGYSNLLTKTQNVANGINRPVEKSENEFDIFGKSIAAQLKNMPLEMAIEAQMFVQNYLSDIRLRSLQRSTPNSQHSSASHSDYM